MIMCVDRIIVQKSQHDMQGYPKRGRGHPQIAQ